MCDECGVRITYPPPTADELAHAYAGWYRPPGGRFVWPGDVFLRRTRGLLARRVDRIAPPGPVLDVGSGDGTLVFALRARGRDAAGVEPSLLGGSRFRDIADITGKWAAVVFWHSLEHLLRPADALARTEQLLVPAGVVVVAAPNVESLQAQLFGAAWLGLDLPRHVVHLLPRAVKLRLRAYGFAVERCSALRGGQAVFGWLHGLVGLLPGTADLYETIRRPAARRRSIDRRRRTITLAAAVLLLPVAATAALLEAALGRGGSIYVEARRV